MRRYEFTVTVMVYGAEEARFRDAAQLAALELRRAWQAQFEGSRIGRIDIRGTDEEYSIDFDVPMHAPSESESESRMMGHARGTVSEWHDDEGWGVLNVPGLDGGCWAHYSAIQMPGYRRLDRQQAVDVEWERVQQDGYAYRAVRIVP